MKTKKITIDYSNGIYSFCETNDPLDVSIEVSEETFNLWNSIYDSFGMLQNQLRELDKQTWEETKDLNK